MHGSGRLRLLYYGCLGHTERSCVCYGPMKSWLLTGRNSLAHPSVVFRKSILLRTGGYDDTYPIAEDHHLWLRCVRWFNFCHIDEVLLDYNSNHNPKYDPMYPRLASESQFRTLQHMGMVGVRKD